MCGAIMVIKFFLDHDCSKDPLFVDISVMSMGACLFNQTLDLSKKYSVLDINFNLAEFNYQKLTILFSTDNFNILQYPLTISNIILDNFYFSKSITHSASRNFNQKFLDYSKKENIYLDTSTNDDNCLNFTGSLVYTVKWPFFKNIIK